MMDLNALRQLIAAKMGGGPAPMTQTPNPQNYAPNVGPQAVQGPGLWGQLQHALTPDFTPSPQQQAEMQRQVQKRMQEEALRRKMQEEALRQHINATMQRAQQAPVADAPQIVPQGGLPEGGNPNQIQMSPAIIDALRRSGAM